MKNYYNYKNFFNDSINRKKIELERARDRNKKIESLKAERDELKSLSDNVEIYRHKLKSLYQMVLKESSEYKDRRLGFLNDCITDALLEIFPDSGFSANIELTTSRNIDKAYVSLKDTKGNTRMPFMQEGKLCQYLVSFAAVKGVTAAAGYHNIYIDEAFGASSIDNLVKIGDILEDTAKKGTQFIVVSQNPALYSGIPRHEIHFHKDPISEKVVIDEIIDK